MQTGERRWAPGWLAQGEQWTYPRAQHKVHRQGAEPGFCIPGKSGMRTVSSSLGELGLGTS